MKNRKKKVWMAGALCVLPWMAFAQQTEPLTGPSRLYDEAKELFLRHDYAAARQALTHYLRQEPQTTFDEEVAYMLACTSYELGKPDRISQLETYIARYPDSRYLNRVYALLGSACFFDGNYRKPLLVSRSAISTCLPIPSVMNL